MALVIVSVYSWMDNWGFSMVKKVLKYGTGMEVPEGAVYLYSTKNGLMDDKTDLKFVWHYFLVEVVE